MMIIEFTCLCKDISFRMKDEIHKDYAQIHRKRKQRKQNSSCL